MDSLNYSLLEKLSDEDIKVISRNIDLELLLHPIKQNSKKYAKKSSILGRLDKKSSLVQKNMPGLAYDLYKKNDINYVKLFAIEVSKFKNNLINIIAEFTNNEVTIENMKLYSCDDYLSLLNELVGQSGNLLDLNLFFIQLKLNEVNVSDEIKKCIYFAWERIEENKHVKIEAEKEIEKVKREQKNIAKDQIKANKVQFTDKISSLQELQQKMKDAIDEKQADIDEKQNVISYLIVDGNEKDAQIENLKEKLLKQKEQNKIIIQENKVLSHNIEVLDVQIHSELAKSKEEWKKQWEVENQNLITENEGLLNRIKIINLEIFDKKNEYEELQLSLEKTKKNIEEYTEILQNKMNTPVQKDELEYRNYDVVQNQTNSMTYNALLVEEGYVDVALQKCCNYQEFQSIVEDNFKNVGYNRKNEILQNEISAAINSRLIPLLCGYGSRKIATAYLAARYGEMPSIISLPNGFGNTRELAYAINDVCTKSVIIEDLFGRMSENVILPILRKKNEKQIVFCCEDTSELKYIEKYFFNYIQLIKIEKMYNNGDSVNIAYSNADDYVERAVYGNRTEGHKITRLLLDQIDIADSYIISRGDIITYMMQEMKHSLDEVLKAWFHSELKVVLDEEQRKKVSDIIESNSSSFNTDLVGSI